MIKSTSQNNSNLLQNAGISIPPESGSKIRLALAAVKKGAPEQDIRSAIRAAAEAVTSFSWLSKGDTVFIKPALNSGYWYPATTSPVAIAEMIKLLKEKGAGRVIVGDMAGIQHVKLSRKGVLGSTRHLMLTSGIARAVLAAGGQLHFFEEAGWKAFYEDFPAAGSHWKRGLMMPDILKKVDHIILMPRCARHILAGSTLGMKAAVGYWRTDTRLEFHRYASTLQEKIAESNTVSTLLKKQRLVISAADKILTTYGPDEGFVSQPDVGLIMASGSVVAHDMVSFSWLLHNRVYIPIMLKMWFRDPYKSQLIAGLGNRWIVNLLGGMRHTLLAEKYIRNDIKVIWDDRVLNRAYEIFGGVPELIFEDANMVPEDIKKLLIKMTTPKVKFIPE